MSRKTKDEAELIKAVAIACERAYRRGFQQGTLAGKVDPVRVYRWRYGKGVAGPHIATAFDGTFQTTAIERLRMEELRLSEELQASTPTPPVVDPSKLTKEQLSVLVAAVKQGRRRA